MKKQPSLNELYAKYKLGELNKRDFEGHIFTYILSHCREFYLSQRDMDQSIEYLCDLYPRLTASIDEYKDIGSSFEKYIKVKLFWFIKECRCRELDLRVTEYACWETAALERDSYACDASAEYLDSESANKTKKPADSYLNGKKLPNPRQVLVLLLKCYFFISDEFASKAAPALGLSADKLIRLIDALRTRRFERDQEIRQFRDRLHSQYYRCISFARRLHASPEGSAHSAVMAGRLSRALKRYASMKKRFAQFSLEATNQQIAEVLGIPKGTVDSNPYQIKHKTPIIPATKKGTLASKTT